MVNDLTRKNHEYWLHRASGYSEVNQEELAGVQRGNWSAFLQQEIREAFPGRTPGEIRILDIGAGPGFLSIILAEMGYQVVAADFAERMLEEAYANAKAALPEITEDLWEDGEEEEWKAGKRGYLRSASLGGEISFRQENAMSLTFPEGSFDVVLSRNLTWNLPEPETAYRDWLRVLKADGLLMVLDANWYRYLVDIEKKHAYDKDRERVAEKGFGDYNIGENFDQMEEIARSMPMTERIRPAWDQDLLRRYGAKDISVAEDIGQRVYSEKEKVNYASTPMFMVKAKKS
jgi:SAM-dependent methyltransferase